MQLQRSGKHLQPIPSTTSTWSRDPQTCRLAIVHSISYLILVQLAVLEFLFTFLLECDDDEADENVDHEECDDDDVDNIEDGNIYAVIVFRTKPFSI